MPFNVEHPLAYYGALSAAMSACLYLFISVARQLQSLKRRVDRRLSDVEREAGVVVFRALRRVRIVQLLQQPGAVHQSAEIAVAHRHDRHLHQLLAALP